MSAVNDSTDPDLIRIRYREAKTPTEHWSDWRYKTIGEQHSQVTEFYAAYRLFRKRNAGQLTIEYGNGSAMQIEVVADD